MEKGHYVKYVDLVPNNIIVDEFHARLTRLITTLLLNKT